MKKYNIYGMGAAIVDTEVVVSDSFIKENNIGKGLMTLVDAERQKYLIDSLTTQRIPVKMSCCLLYTSPSPRDQRGSRMPSSA